MVYLDALIALGGCFGYPMPCLGGPVSSVVVPGNSCLLAVDPVRSVVVPATRCPASVDSVPSVVVCTAR